MEMGQQEMLQIYVDDMYLKINNVRLKTHRPWVGESILVLLNHNIPGHHGNNMTAYVPAANISCRYMEHGG